jgi:hypothetical protein
MDAQEQLAAIRHLAGLFERDRIDYWLFGGWAVDFHVGHVTREHADIDIAVWQADLEAIGALLVADGWARSAEPGEDGYTTYRRNSLNMDLAYLARGELDTVYTPLASGCGEWPPHSFGPEVRELAGTRAHVVSFASLLADKSVRRDDLATAVKDAADVAVLRSASGSR